MSFFGSLNRKNRRKFKNSSTEEKIEILTAEINKKTAEVRNKAVAAAFMDGYLFNNKMLFEHYIEKMTEDNKGEMVEELLNEIKKNYNQYQNKHKTKQDDNDKKEYTEGDK